MAVMAPHALQLGNTISSESTCAALRFILSFRDHFIITYILLLTFDVISGGVLCVLSCMLGAQAEEGNVLAADDFGVKDMQAWRLEGSGWADEGLKKEGRRIVAMDRWHCQYC